MLRFERLASILLPTEQWEAGHDFRDEWNQTLHGPDDFMSPLNAATALGGLERGKREGNNIKSTSVCWHPLFLL